jgi:hypothetical protein
VQQVELIPQHDPRRGGVPTMTRGSAPPARPHPLQIQLATTNKTPTTKPDAATSQFPAPAVSVHRLHRARKAETDVRGRRRRASHAERHRASHGLVPTWRGQPPSADAYARFSAFLLRHRILARRCSQFAYCTNSAANKRSATTQSVFS